MPSLIFKRRAKGNQRFRNRKEHRLPLEVPLSRKEVVMRRRKLFLHSLQWVLICGATVWAVLFTGELWQRAFRTSGDFAVGQFELVTNGVITVPQVADVTGLRPERNITDIDLGEIRTRLLELPRVSRADVERRLPNHLSIRLEERLPAAWLSCASQNIRAMSSKGLLVDQDGVVFPCGQVLKSYSILPVIHCANLSAVTAGRQVAIPAVRSALDLARRMARRTWPVPMALEQVHIVGEYTLVAQMDTDALFTFLPENLDRQLARLDAILEKSRSSGRRVASVNLQLDRNIPVRFMDDSAQPSAEISNPKNDARSSRRSSPAGTDSEAHGILRGA